MLIEAERVSLGYDGVPVVQDVSLRIAPGEFVAIVGPNASGKSTLLRGLGRLLRPLSGRVCYDGEDARRIRSNEVARRLALLPQLPELDVDLTVEELVWRGRTPYQRALRPPTEADAVAVDRAIAEADLEDLRLRPLRRLSGGERQRAWIGLALAQEPEALLLDEPTTFLDLRHQLEIMRVLRRLHGDGLTVVAVQHDLALAAPLRRPRGGVDRWRHCTRRRAVRGVRGGGAGAGVRPADDRARRSGDGRAHPICHSTASSLRRQRRFAMGHYATPEDAYWAFFDQFNANSADGWAGVMSYPHVRVSPPRGGATPRTASRVFATAADYAAQAAATFERIRATGWVRTEGIEPERVHTSEDRVHLAGRVDALRRRGRADPDQPRDLRHDSPGRGLGDPGAVRHRHLGRGCGHQRTRSAWRSRSIAARSMLPQPGTMRRFRTLSHSR